MSAHGSPLRNLTITPRVGSSGAADQAHIENDHSYIETSNNTHTHTHTNKVKTQQTRQTHNHQSRGNVHNVHNKAICSRGDWKNAPSPTGSRPSDVTRHTLMPAAVH